MPVQSSRLIQSSGPSRVRLKLGICSSGVGRCAKRIRGNRARFIGGSGSKKIGTGPHILRQFGNNTKADCPRPGRNCMFKAVLIERDAQPYRAGVQSLDEARLPAGDVTVRIDYSTLNYKDALAITGKGPVVRQFPMVPGIDFAGTVHASENSSYAIGDRVLLNGWGVGEHHWGGLAQLARVKGEWLLPLPAAFTPRQSMAIGTAGYTAMLCVMALERHGVTPDK